MTVVRVNRFDEGEEEQISLHALAPKGERRQIERTQRVRAAEREAGASEVALGRVREAARRGENLLYPKEDALAASCTVGEICDALREEFGTFDAHLSP